MHRRDFRLPGKRKDPLNLSAIQKRPPPTEFLFPKYNQPTIYICCFYRYDHFKIFHPLQFPEDGGIPRNSTELGLSRETIPIDSGKRREDTMAESTKRTSADPDGLASHLADLRSRDGIRRELAREAIVSLGRQAVDPLTELLADPNHQTRWEAAKALSEMADPRSASALVSSLEDREFDVRWLSAIGLIAIGKDSLVPLLEALSRRSESVWLREGAHHVLHDLSKKGFMDLAAPILTALEGTEPGIEVQGPARAALAKLKPKGWKRQKNL
jgi:hypothetical protein